MDIVLSVIVHVYNIAPYLRRCMDSLLIQGMEMVGKYELICVDDGSNDGSSDILLEYSRHHPHLVRLIIQETKGVARSRNAGLREARGKYVAFVNGDDYLVEGGYGYVMKHFCRLEESDAESGVGEGSWVMSAADGMQGAISSSVKAGEGSAPRPRRGKKRPQVPDVVSFWNVVMNDYQKRHYNYSDTPEGDIIFEGDGTEAYNRFGMSFVTDKLFRLEFLREHTVRFEDLRISEDAMYCFRLFQHNPHIVMTSCNIYRYTRERDSFVITSYPQVTIIFMLESEMYLIKVLDNYLCRRKLPMAEGVKWALDSQLKLYHTRALAARLDRKKWSHHMRALRAVPHHHLRGKGKWVFISRLLNLSAHNYLFYKMASSIYRHLYDRHLRKHVK